MENYIVLKDKLKRLSKNAGGEMDKNYDRENDRSGGQNKSQHINDWCVLDRGQTNVKGQKSEYKNIMKEIF